MAGLKYLTLLIGAACLVGGCNFDICEEIETTQVPPGHVESATFLRSNTSVGDLLFEGKFPHGVWQVDDEEHSQLVLNEGGASGEGGAPFFEAGETGEQSKLSGRIASAELEVDPKALLVHRRFLDEEGEEVTEQWEATARVETDGSFAGCADAKHEVYNLTLKQVEGTDAQALSTRDYFNFEATLEPIIQNGTAVGYLFHAKQVITTTERFQDYGYEETYLF